ncbi:putative nuclease HARBI1 [Astyanax mexicanus]|uniref:Putative nuclease HARBI1 n=2 Tax=Astyanax mexicanus TaxID=7994 RepID=A0A8B9KAL2_ASTMX|nr:putative nuclease HARBI1 [Astyanax mexicanus]KAG9264113.1 putative nuclease HARBI1 [Astyanax mexicanus]
MEIRKACLGTAGRFMMDIMQFEWEPLGHWELDQRLDQAVEEMIESDLMASIQAQCSPVLMQVSPQEDFIPFTQDQAQTVTIHLSEQPVSALFQEEGSVSEQQEHVGEIEGNPTVQYITALLQNSSSSHSQSRMTGRARLSLPHTVFLSLTLLSKRLSYRSVSSTFHLEKGNIHRIFFSFCDRVSALQDQLIRWHTGEESLQYMLPFCSWLGWDERLEERGLPRIFGVLGHTRIPIRLPISKQDVESATPDTKRLKKEPHPDSWLNLELVCNSEGRFMHCHISRGSDRHRASSLSEKLQQNPQLMPPGSCLLARVGYPLTGHILTPFSPGRSPQENLYNRSVEAHLGRFDQAVADLKERFQKLRYLDMANFERAKAVVLTCCILHNVFLDMGHVIKGQVEREMREEEGEEGMSEEAGVALRDTVVNLLYSALESGTA